MVEIPVVHNKKRLRLSSLCLLLKESNYPGFGMLVRHLPVTKVEARDAGLGEWGYTKFIADMKFRIIPVLLKYLKTKVVTAKGFE